MKSMVFDRYLGRMLLVHGAKEPSSEEWGEYVEALLRAHEANQISGIMVLSDGVGPDATQRQEVSSVKVRTAVVTHSRVGRGIVTALGWAGVDIRAFPPSSINQAAEFLGFDEPETDKLVRKLVSMRLLLAQGGSKALPESRSELEALLVKTFKEIQQV